jgi:amidase
VLDRPGAEEYLDDPECRAAVAGAAQLLERLGHHVEMSAPEAMFEHAFARHFNTIIAADTEATFRAFESLLGRRISEEEIEPRNAAYRKAGATMDALTYLQSRAWIGMWARRMARWLYSQACWSRPRWGLPRRSWAGSPRRARSWRARGSPASSRTPHSST